MTIQTQKGASMNKRNWAEINHPVKTDTKTVYHFSTTRECSQCGEPRPRSAGTWISDRVWLCHLCMKGDGK